MMIPVKYGKHMDKGKGCYLRHMMFNMEANLPRYMVHNIHVGTWGTWSSGDYPSYI